MRKLNKLAAISLTGIFMIAGLSGCGSSPSTTTASTPEGTTADEAETKTTAISEADQVEITIMAAASLTDVAKEITDMYQKTAPNVKLTFSFGSSGALQTQIEEGAPADVFLSAAQKQMTELSEKGLVDDATKVDLLENKVVLITPKDSKLDIKEFKDLEKDSVKSVALGEPSSVPVGQYSETILENIGILDAVKAKANYGTDVRQVLTWVESGEVDCGLVYATDAAISDLVNVICEAPKDSSDPVIYPAAVLKDSKQADAATAFVQYLNTDEVLAVFEKYGFSRVK